MAHLEQFLGLGFLMLGFLSVSSYADDLAGFRIPWFYRELEPMQQRWGKNAGTILHVVGYVIAPVGFGILFLSGMVFP
jgi:hypothetical protein